MVVRSWNDLILLAGVIQRSNGHITSLKLDRTDMMQELGTLTNNAWITEKELEMLILAGAFLRLQPVPPPSNWPPPNWPWAKKLFSKIDPLTISGP